MKTKICTVSRKGSGTIATFCAEDQDELQIDLMELMVELGIENFQDAGYSVIESTRSF